MTKRQHENYMRMYNALKKIRAYASSDWIRKNSEKTYGLDPDEAIEMTYDSIKQDAFFALRGVPSIPEASIKH